MTGTMLAAMDVPPIVVIVLGVVALALLVMLARSAYRRLGPTRLRTMLVVLLAGALLYAGVTLLVAWRTAGDFATLASREKSRADAVLARMARLGPATTPLGESCATADRMQLDELVAAFAEPALKVNEFRHFGADDHLNVDTLGVPTTSPSLYETWQIIAFNPGKSHGRLPSPAEYVLSRKRYALVHSAGSAALIDLEDGHLICTGALPPAPAQEVHSRGRFLRPLLPLCERIEGEACARITNTLNRKDT